MTNVIVNVNDRSAQMLATTLGTAPEHLDAIDGIDGYISMHAVQKRYMNRITSHSFSALKFGSANKPVTEKSQFYFVDNGDGDPHLDDLIVFALKSNKAGDASYNVSTYKYSIFSQYFIRNVRKPENELVPIVYDPGSVLCGVHCTFESSERSRSYGYDKYEALFGKQFIDVPPQNMRHIFDYVSRHIFHGTPHACIKTTDIDGELVDGGCNLFGFVNYMSLSFRDDGSTSLMCAPVDEASAWWYCY